MSSIDVIIPIKGRPELLQNRSLPSLLAQTLQTFKVTIVDDGSTLEEFQKIQEIAVECRRKGLNIDVIQNGGSAGAAGGPMRSPAAGPGAGRGCGCGGGGLADGHHPPS